MELPEGIEWPESVRGYEASWTELQGKNADVASVIIIQRADAAISDLIDMVRRFYWQRNELLRLHTAYPKVMKEKLEAEWEKRK